MLAASLAWCVVAAILAADPAIRPDQPNVVAFAPQDARFVRFLIQAASRGEACIDELEVYGADDRRNLALAAEGAKATASSCLAGHRQHAIEHLNDGEYGNDHSWIPATTGDEWAQIELPKPTKVAKVVFSRDRNRLYVDRVPTQFEVLLSMDGRQWTSVKKVSAQAAAVVALKRLGDFAAVLPSPPPPPTPARVASEELLQCAFLGEEHAWLKTFGRADISPQLVPYNGRVKEYPRHVGDDRLPLAPLSSEPKLDGVLDDPCWAEASRGVVRVAWPYEFHRSPLVTHEVRAGWKGSELLVAIRTDRLLSSHVAVVSTIDGDGCGIVAFGRQGLVFNTYTSEEPRRVKLKESTPVAGAFNKDLTCFEFRLPLALFPECRKKGIRVGLGMGAKHTLASGRAVNYRFAPLSIAELGPCLDRKFRVRLSAAPGGDAVKLRGNAPDLAAGITLGPGQSKTVSLPADRGPIGPQYDLKLEQPSGETYVLHLFRYDPLERTLVLMQELINRLAEKGLDVAAERGQFDKFRQQQERLLSVEAANPAAERQAFFEARLSKRQLLLREPELAPIARILLVHRQAYRPSHNYSVMLDAPWRPGGDVSILEIPRRGGRFEPEQSRLTKLFDSGKGISRDPMAAFDLSKIYFAYRASEPEYFHVMRINPDGTGLEQLTEGPFHDYWPCPLPDGGLAMISTRCRCRFLCWRPQTAVLFRMDADGQNIRPLSFANLSEWGPSVMSDGRIIWQRSEYVDKGADFSHTLWSIRPDGTQPELVFGNTIIQPNGYANGREVPGTHEICCTLISHFGDLNGPIALVDLDKGRFNPKAIQSLTPEVPWPGMWPGEECFRDPFPIARDYVLCSHAPRDRFGAYVIDRFGNRELLHLDPAICSMTPTPLRVVKRPPVLYYEAVAETADEWGQLAMADVYQGIAPAVARGTVKYIRVVEEVRAGLERTPNGEYRKDHEPFTNFYATPVDRVSGPFGWSSYVAKAAWGLTPVEEDGSANFNAPAGKQLYLQVLDKDFNELQRMRSVVQLQPGEKRSCIGCHEDRRQAPIVRPGIALRRAPNELEKPSWGTEPFAYEKVVQPIWDAKCVACHDRRDKRKIDLTATLDYDRVPASYRTLISQGWVHYLDYGYNSGGNEKREPLTFGTVKSKLWKVLDAGHYEVRLTRDEMHRIKCWTDLNCPLWPDYLDRRLRPGPEPQLTGR